MGCRVSKTDSLFVETARKLGEDRRILEGVEATALGGVAQMLALYFDGCPAYREAEKMLREVLAAEGIEAQSYPNASRNSLTAFGPLRSRPSKKPA
jgi:hypothetical protein